jgi:seryl-tRNA synthetase
MIDLKQLRDNPGRYREGCRRKNIHADIDRILVLDEQRRAAMTQIEALRAEQNKLAKESGPLIGKLQGQLKAAQADQAGAIQAQIEELKSKPAALKGKIAELEAGIAGVGAELDGLLLTVPLPPDDDVPVGKGSDDNVELRRWNAPASELLPNGFDTSKSFKENKGFHPRTHLELLRHNNLADFERGVKVAGSRSYILMGMGMRLHQAVQRYAFDYMVDTHGFTPMSVPTIVREETMVGTGFFPAGREQAYHVEESKRGGGYDLFLTGTGEVGLMGVHMGEILDEAQLPLKYVTVSPCYRREAGAAGKDTAGLYRIHQFDKVEQVVICKADEAESRQWHKRMIGYVEEILQSLEIPHRLLQCCSGDLGVKNADMVDIESWMPGRGTLEKVGDREVPKGEFGETHSASRLYDFQCRRLNMRYRAGGEGGRGETTVCHSLNNTVLASPRFLIPLLEIHQNEDGSINVPRALRPYVGGASRVGK